MKVSKEWLLVALALSLGFVYGAVSFFSRIFFLADIQFILILVLVRFAVDPFLMFTVFYVYGRKVDLKARLTTMIVLLFTGLYVGNFLGNIVTFPVVTHLRHSPSFLSIVFRGLFPTVIMSPFFVALSASAIAYIRNTKTSSEKGKA
ncbi:MAG: hypothetical protein U9O89_02445 [Thermoproteota archaeon]|nr:hypothetical protein [Thermoproteota archaeon]